MRPLSLCLSKAFLPFCNRPIIEYTLQQLVDQNWRTVVLVVGLGDIFAERYVAWGEKRGLKVAIVKRGLQYGSGGVIRDVILGTPGLHRHHDFLVIYADSILAIDFRRMTTVHRNGARRDCLVTVATHRPDDLVPVGKRHSNYGVLRVNEAGRAILFVEKPAVHLINAAHVASAGVFILNRRVLDRFPNTHPVDLSRDVIPSLAASGSSPVFGFEIKNGFRYDVGTLDDYVPRQFAMLTGNMKIPGIRLEHVLSTGTAIGGGKTYGECMVGPGCRLSSGCKLLGMNILGRSVLLGEGAVLRNCIIFDHVHIGKHARISGCVLGSHCRIGNHVRLKPGTVVGDYGSIH